MRSTVDEERSARFEHPLTFKALEERGLCPT